VCVCVWRAQTTCLTPNAFIRSFDSIIETNARSRSTAWEAALGGRFIFYVFTLFVLGQSQTAIMYYIIIVMLIWHFKYLYTSPQTTQLLYTRCNGLGTYIPICMMYTYIPYYYYTHTLDTRVTATVVEKKLLMKITKNAQHHYNIYIYIYTHTCI